MSFKRFAIAAAVGVAVLLGAGGGDSGLLPPAVHAAPVEAWRAEFEAVCGKTGEATSLTVEELTKLIERCEKLKPAVDKLEATERKVYQRRLQLCCDLFRYVRSSKEANK
jgi:hypothetical protein